LVLAALDAQWRSLKALVIPQVLLLDLSDPQVLLGQGLKQGLPAGEAWSAPLPARTCREGVPVVLDAVGDFIGDLLLEYSAPDVGLVVALPWELAHWRVLEWPQGRPPEDPLAELRTSQPDLGWPFSLDQACLDVQPLVDDPSCSLVVGMARDALEAWIEVFAIAGGSLRHLLPSQMCQQLAIAATLEASTADELVALLQPDSTGCQLVVWRAGVPEFQRHLPLEPAALVPALDQALRFCRQRLAGAAVRLLLAEPMEAADAIAEQLELPLEWLDRGGYGSLQLAGLGLLDLS
jgi:Tfp pilus assembly PilM family ATPase